MEYQKIINLLENTSNQPFFCSKFRTKDWIKQIMVHERHITLIAKLHLKL